jgi:hypothetical protein
MATDGTIISGKSIKKEEMLQNSSIGLEKNNFDLI